MDFETICRWGRDVIETEANMLQSLSRKIDKNFYKACCLLRECAGRIILMGVGKSGHISKKIAATLSSTGSPAYFIHPNEAKHGDIGMIGPKDVVVMVSHSGESDELIDLLPSIKRLNIPFIVLTGNPSSTLASKATIYIDVGIEKEACPLGLAPTSSTTASLVMGDAIAMTLLQERGFTKEDFAISHPGGSLGRRLLLRVDEIMHANETLPIIPHHASLKTALLEITQKKLGMTTVVNENGELVGIFTDGDLRRTFEKPIDIQQTPIHELMTKTPKTIAGHLLAADALTLMETYQITSLIITDQQNKPTGIIHIHDILRAKVAS